MPTTQSDSRRNPRIPAALRALGGGNFGLGRQLIPALIKFDSRRLPESLVVRFCVNPDRSTLKRAGITWPSCETAHLVLHPPGLALISARPAGICRLDRRLLTQRCQQA